MFCRCGQPIMSEYYSTTVLTSAGVGKPLCDALATVAKNAEMYAFCYIVFHAVPQHTPTWRHGETCGLVQTIIWAIMPLSRLMLM